jgi:hypothetical protein
MGGGCAAEGTYPGDPGAEAGEGALQSSQASGGDSSKSKSGGVRDRPGGSPGSGRRRARLGAALGPARRWRPVGEVQVEENALNDRGVGEEGEDSHLAGPRFARCPAGHGSGSTS